MREKQCDTCRFWIRETPTKGECIMLTEYETRVKAIVWVAKTEKLIYYPSEDGQEVDVVMVTLNTPNDFYCEAWQLNEKPNGKQ